MDFALAESLAEGDIPLQGPDGDPLPKRALLDEESVVQSRKKRVIDSLPVEVLDVIVRFVPRVYGLDNSNYLDTAIPITPEDEDASDSEHEEPEEEENRTKKTLSSLADLRILTQFPLRLLSRKWAALAYQQNASIGLAYERGRVLFTDGEKDATLILSKPEVPTGCAELKELTDEVVSVIEQHSLLDLVTRLDVRIENSDWWSEPVSAVLGKLTSSSVIPQPCKLDLTLDFKEMEAVHSFVHDFDTPFQEQFPGLSLRELTFDIQDIVLLTPDLFKPTPEHLDAACRCLKHFLASGYSNLVQLDVNFFILKAAFEAQQPGYAGSESPPQAWTCESLRVLRLEFLPFETNYDYTNQPKKTALFAFQGRLPKLFPRLESLAIWGGRPQLDFAVLTHLPALKHLCVFAKRLQQDCNVQPLPNIRSLQIQCEMPFDVSSLVTHADALAFSTFQTNALACLAAEIYRDPLSSLFQNLSKLSIVADKTRPAYADLMRPLRAILEGLPKLAQLELKACSYNDAWLRPGDFGLLSILPAQLKSLSVDYALMPSECVNIMPLPGRLWQLNVSQDVPHAQENIYKGWLRNLLHHISTVPSLEKVHCRCVAPSFASIVRLAEKWNDSSEYALADLGLSCVTHVQCSKNFQRIGVEELQGMEEVRFRFNVTPLAQFKPRSLKKSKRVRSAKKIVSVTFANPE